MVPRPLITKSSITKAKTRRPEDCEEMNTKELAVDTRKEHRGPEGTMWEVVVTYDNFTHTRRTHIQYPQMSGHTPGSSGT